MHDSTDYFTHNNILLSLPKEVVTGLLPLLERVEMPLGKLLYGAEDEIKHVYFPDRAVISVVAYAESGKGSEIAVIGSEGATGLDVVMGSDFSANENITQLADGALRMKTADFRKEFSRCGAFHDILLKFTRNFIIQISQTSLCNRIHTAEKRLARWLLMFHDRSRNDVLHTTQEFMAEMLGANRSTVTVTAIALQNRGFISYKRGKLTIKDRKGLEDFACNCYKNIRDAYGPII